MDDERRNPYFILGIDYGASRDAARKAAGAVSRRVKRDPDALYGIEDVTWALHAIEQAIDDPGSAVDHYRVPADRALFAEMGGLEFRPSRWQGVRQGRQVRNWRRSARERSTKRSMLSFT